MNMRASSSSKIKIRGFMCHSGANAVICHSGAKAVCMANDPRSVLMPRRAANRKYIDHAMLMNKNNSNNNANKYSRLLDAHHQRFASAATAAAANRRKLAAINVQASIKKDEAPGAREQRLKSKPSLTPSQITDQAFQVVVMKVAIHCQGCAGKVKKHLSKMEGVTSFSIDVESRRVTVMGHVSPLLVVESVSKVKRAELWT